MSPLMEGVFVYFTLILQYKVLGCYLDFNLNKLTYYKKIENMADLKYELVAAFSLNIGIIAIISFIKNKLDMYFLSYFIIGFLIVVAEFRRYFTSMSSHNFFLVLHF